MLKRGKRSDRDRLLAALPEDGSFRSNKDVRDEIRLENERYWKVRDQLVDEGLIVKSRGHGGRIARGNSPNSTRPSSPQQKTQIVQEEIKEEVQKTSDDIRREHELYEPFAEAIKKRARDEGAENTIVEITARQGSKSTGGEWSRPDICQVNLRKLRYLGQKIVEVITYELKTSDCSVSAVYEALSHSRRAHRSYLAIYAPQNLGVAEDRMTRIELECARTGVGLLVFSDPKDLSSFDTIVEPKANWVDLSEVDEFISTQINDKEKIRDWL